MLHPLTLLRKPDPLPLLHHLATADTLLFGRWTDRTNHALQELHASLLSGLAEANGCVLKQGRMADEEVESLAVHVGRELVLARVSTAGADVASLEEGEVARVAELVGHGDV